MKKLPEILEYFLLDIMAENSELSARSMFGEWAVFVRGKIFIIFSGGDFYIRENNFIEKSDDKKFFYMKK